MHIILSDLGDDGIALTQWAINQKLEDVYVIYVNTNWQSQAWLKRIDQVKSWCIENQLNFEQLEPQADFSRQVIEHNHFPSIKFQWCAGLIKGTIIADWLDDVDEDEEAIILLPNRKSMCTAHSILEERVEENEYFNDRATWHPLINHNLANRNKLIEQAPFNILSKPAQSCSPCIYNKSFQLTQLDKLSTKRLHELEEKTRQTMFAQPIQLELKENKPNTIKNYYEAYSTGCGWNYGCGL